MEYYSCHLDLKTSVHIVRLCEDLSNAAPNSVIILHACGHNPTGVDLTKEQWIAVAKIIKISRRISKLPYLLYTAIKVKCIAYMKK